MGGTTKRIDLAVFPLMDAVLFPGTTLPLQIREERFVKMVEEVKARGWPLAVSLVRHLGQADLQLNPICGAGDIQLFRNFKDGGKEILVHGSERVRLISVVQQEPYLIMEAERFSSRESESRIPASRKRFQGFLDLVKTWAFLNPDIPDELVLFFDEFESSGELTDFFAFHFLKKVKDKQEYLNCVHPQRRSEMLAQYLQTDIIRLRRRLQKQTRSAILH